MCDGQVRWVRMDDYIPGWHDGNGKNWSILGFIHYVWIPMAWGG